MANEITLNVSVSLYKPSSMTAAIARSMLGALRNMAGNFSSYGELSVGSSVGSNAVVVPLGGLVPATNSGTGIAGSPHYAWFYNNDLASTIRIVDGNQGSSIIAELAPNDVGLIPLYGNCKPYAYCPQSGAPILEYFIMGY